MTLSPLSFLEYRKCIMTAMLRFKNVMRTEIPSQRPASLFLPIATTMVVSVINRPEMSPNPNMLYRLGKSRLDLQSATTATRHLGGRFFNVRVDNTRMTSRCRAGLAEQPWT